MRTLLFALLLTACADEPGQPVGCEVEVCSKVPQCFPLMPADAEDWDLRTVTACLDTFSCGPTPDACRQAMLDLPCFTPPVTDPDESHAIGVALGVAFEACGIK